MDVLREKVAKLETRVDNHDFILMGNPKAGVRGVLARFDELVTRLDEREKVDQERHEKVMRSQSNQMLRITIVGVIATFALLILAWFTYQDAKARMGVFAPPPPPAHSLLQQPPTQAKYTHESGIEQPDFEYNTSR